MKTLLLLFLFSSDINALASGEFEVREQAEARLSCYADLAYPLLTRNFKDCEQRRRARRIVARAVPQSCPSLALLSGKPLAEWCSPGERYGMILSYRPGPEWRLGWLRPDPQAPLACVVRHYHDLARQQWEWKDWAEDRDGREATCLMVRDMIAVGVPLVAVRAFCRWLEVKERALEPPGRMERLP